MKTTTTLRMLFCGLLTLASIAALAQTRAPVHAVPPRAQQIHNQLRAVLSSPDFQSLRHAPPTTPSWLDRIMRWLRHYFNRQQTTTGLKLSPLASSILTILLFAGLSILLGLLLAWIVKQWLQRAAGTPRSSRKKRPNVSVTEPVAEEAHSARAWLEAAEQLAATGDYRRAYRAVFIAMLLKLDAAGYVRYRGPLTNGDYLRALRAHPTLLVAVRPVANRFDSFWYGRASAEESDYRRSLEAYTELPSSAPAQ